VSKCRLPRGGPVPAFANGRRAKLFLVRVAYVCGVFGAAGCARGGSPDVTPRVTPDIRPAAGLTPVIERVEPASGWAGQDYPTDATIYGVGFAESGNVIVFGPVTLDERASTQGGTQIVFSVPKQQPSRIEVPPMVLEVGEYAVTVSNAYGTSNAVIFTLTRPGSGPAP